MALPPMRLAAGIASGVGVLLLVVVQFVPFAGFDVSFGGASIDIQGTPWEVQADARGGGESQSDDEGWYSDENDEADGVGMIRSGTILLLIGLVALAGACLVTFLMPGLVGGIAAGVATVILVVGFILESIGMSKAMDEAGQFFGENSGFLVGFYFGIVALVLAAAATLLAFLARTTAPVQARPTPQATTTAARVPAQAPRRPGTGF